LKKKVLTQFISEDKTFQGLKLDYRGSDTYYIQAKGGNDEIKNFMNKLSFLDYERALVGI
jgi:hypothetical protein